jgi:hypothetical protein
MRSVRLFVANTVPMIGVEPDELCWLRMLVSLLRHPDPTVPELARQALLYLTDAAAKQRPAAAGK